MVTAVLSFCCFFSLGCEIAGSGMADLYGGEGGEGFRTEASSGGNAASLVSIQAPPLVSHAMLATSASYKGDGKSSGKERRRPAVRPSLDAEEFINLLHGSDPIKVELNRLENEVRGGNVVRSTGFYRCFDFLSPVIFLCQRLIFFLFSCFWIFRQRPGIRRGPR